MIKKGKVILITLGLLLFLICTVSWLFIVNFTLGHIITYGVSCIIILYGLFYDKLIKIKWLTYCILALCTSFLIMMSFIYSYGKSDNVTFSEDAVVVLGAAIRGEQVIRPLSYRLDKAVEYSVNNPKAVIVVSGGKGAQEDITEAVAMERYLIDKGVPKESIIKEELSTSTYENLLYSKEILDKLFNGHYKTVVITNDFHIFRATKLAEKLGFNVTHYNAKIDWYSVPLNYSRECLAILKLWILEK